MRIMLHSYLQTVVCLDLEKFMHCCTLCPLLSISYNRLQLVTGCLFAALMQAIPRPEQTASKQAAATVSMAHHLRRHRGAARPRG